MYFELNENERSNKKLWDAASVIRGKFISILDKIKRINDLSEEYIKHKISRRKKIIRIRAEINELES